jgi:hypothetical protein
LLSLTHKQATHLGAAVREGRARPEDLAAELWAPYAGQETCCFLCDAPVVLPACVQCVPDKKPGLMMAVPLCGACAALPFAQRAHRCLRLTRKMWGRKPPPQSHAGRL